MTKIILSGCFGNMGRVITQCVSQRDDCEIVAGVDIFDGNAPYPVFKSFDEVSVDADVVIDFSHPSVLASLISYCKNNNCPVVVATTGLNEDQKMIYISSQK